MNCDHGPEYRCFDCATDDELAAAIPPHPDEEKFNQWLAAQVPAAHAHDSDYEADTCPICFPDAAPVDTATLPKRQPEG